MIGGIYEIVNSANGKRYIGSAKSFVVRWNAHKVNLRWNSHRNAHLQSAWKKRGEGAFLFSPLLICAPKDLLMYEQLCLDSLQPEYNIAKSATAPMLGRTASVEHRAKISRALTGKVVSVSHRQALSIANKGKPLSQEHRKKLSVAKQGKIRFSCSEETRAKIRFALQGRKYGPLSKERKAAISAFQSSRKRAPFTAATRDKIGAALREKPWSIKRRLAHEAKYKVL